MCPRSPGGSDFVGEIGRDTAPSQKTWLEVCFLPDMYITDTGDKEATMAEFILEW